MPKQVNGGQEDGDLGKPLAAGQKRGLEVNINGAGGEMVVGRMATRSVTKSKKVGGQEDNPMESSDDDPLVYKKFQEWAQKHQKTYKTADEKKERFNIWCSTKEWVDANTSHEPGGVTYGLNSLSDLTSSEIGHKYRCRRRKSVDDPHKKHMQTLKFCDSELGKELAEEKEAFDKWVAKHKRNYGSEHERARSFPVYFRNKKKIKSLRERNPGCYSTIPDELDMKMDQVLTMAEVQRLVNLKAGPSNLC